MISNGQKKDRAAPLPMAVAVTVLFAIVTSYDDA
jgi:hypothetical protein